MDALQLLQSCKDKLSILDGMIPLAQYQEQLVEIDNQLNNPDLWNDPKSASTLMKDRKKLSDLVESITQFKDQVQFYTELVELYPEEIEKEGTNIFILHSKMSDLEFKQMMQDPVDDSPAIVSISAGAGGLESSNFVSMLLRMYVRYADSHGYKIEILDEKRSEEHSSICIDSVSIRVEGSYAYGYLKGENGVARLIRSSPFNAANARQTSFAAVQVTADIEDTIDVNIEDKDIEITAQTAGGPGGQNQNRIKSAIRLKHLPTGINILVRTERDQLSNKKTAFKMLKAKLYEIEVNKKKLEQDRYVSNLSDVSFGSQIRTYTASPYSLVKDHRTGYEVNNFDQVLDGDIHEFLVAYLRYNVGK